MSLTFGFYNSLNHDRRYDARQFSSIFDGVINDGVYMAIGDRMMVKSLSGMNITIGTGRAWFNHTWSLNDSLYTMTVPPAEYVLNRIDTVVLEVDEDARENNFKIIKGTPSASPVAPTLTNTDTIRQYPLADIRVNAGATAITQANITNRVGTFATPFVTGVVQSMNIDDLIAQWSAEWNELIDGRNLEWNELIDRRDSEWNMLINDVNSEWDGLTDRLNSEINLLMYDKKTDFERWFNDLQVLLDGDVAAVLAERIAQLENRWIDFARTQEIIDNIDDSTGAPISDSNGTIIQGHIIFKLAE